MPQDVQGLVMGKQSLEGVMGISGQDRPRSAL